MQHNDKAHCPNEVEVSIRKAIRHFMCNQHEGGKAFLELFAALETVSLDRENVRKILDDELSQPPGYKDPQLLEAEVAVKLMRFQHAVNNQIEKVEIHSIDRPEGNRVWEVKIEMSEKTLPQHYPTTPNITQQI